MESGVLLVLDTPITTSSASPSISGDLPSSHLMANSMAFTRRKYSSSMRLKSPGVSRGFRLSRRPRMSRMGPRMSTTSFPCSRALCTNQCLRPWSTRVQTRTAFLSAAALRTSIPFSWSLT